MRHRPRRQRMAEINIVPYIDVMLVLLVVFMITAPLINQGVEIALPEAASNPLPGDEIQPLVLQIDRVGRYFMDMGSDEVRSLNSESVLTHATAVLRREPRTPVLVEADADVDYGTVIRGMSLLQKAGARRVGLATRPVTE